MKKIFSTIAVFLVLVTGCTSTSEKEQIKETAQQAAATNSETKTEVTTQNTEAKAEVEVPNTSILTENLKKATQEIKDTTKTNNWTKESFDNAENALQAINKVSEDIVKKDPELCKAILEMDKALITVPYEKNKELRGKYGYATESLVYLVGKLDLVPKNLSAKNDKLVEEQHFAMEDIRFAKKLDVTMFTKLKKTSNNILTAVKNNEVYVDFHLAQYAIITDVILNEVSAKAAKDPAVAREWKETKKVIATLKTTLGIK